MSEKKKSRKKVGDEVVEEKGTNRKGHEPNKQKGVEKTSEGDIKGELESLRV